MNRAAIAITMFALAGGMTPAGAANASLQPEPGRAIPVTPTPMLRPPPMQPGDATDDGPEITPEVGDAVRRGLAYLAENQLADGSFSGDRYGRNVAVVSLACLAFMSDGHMPGRGAYGDNVRRGLEFILNNTADNGLIAADSSHGPMYGHGFATLFLGEVYGMTAGGGDTQLSNRTHEALLKAVRLIEQSQNEEGGWRYNPTPFDADTSVTICQVMALRSARNAGIRVDKKVIDSAVEYIRRCQNADGGFRYQAGFGPSAFPRSAAGVATYFYAGIEDYAEEIPIQRIRDGLGYIMQSGAPGSGGARQYHYFYGHYYAAQAMFLAGGTQWGEAYWKTWWPAIRAELLDTQLPDGSWPDTSVGSAYGTSMALIVLQMPNRYMPIFQR